MATDLSNWSKYDKNKNNIGKDYSRITRLPIGAKSEKEKQKLQSARNSFQILREEEKVELEEKLKFKNERRAIREYEDSLRPQKHAWMQLIKVIVISKQF